MTVALPPAMLDASKLTNPFAGLDRLLFTQAVHATAPWQYTVYSKLHELERGIGSTVINNQFPVSQPTIMFARMVLSDLHELNIPAPVICPTSGGDIGMVWLLGFKQLEVIFSADQTGSFVLSRNDEIVEDGELSIKSTSKLENALKSMVLA